jgi:hypothetical protein
MVKKGFAAAARNRLFSTLKSSFRDGQSVYFLTLLKLLLGTYSEPIVSIMACCSLRFVGLDEPDVAGISENAHWWRQYRPLRDASLSSALVFKHKV